MAADWSTLTLQDAGSLSSSEVLGRLGVTSSGLSPAEADRRRTQVGANAVRTHGVQPWRILGRQLRSALLVLLAVTAALSFFVGEKSDAIIIGTILVASVGLGFINEYRAARAAESLHSSITHACPVMRDGREISLPVTELVPGDVVRLSLGAIVPADLRLITANGLSCNESALTGESLPIDKDVKPVPAGTGLTDLEDCALMGTIVQSGAATGVVVATGGRTEFGRIALGLGEGQPETDFQAGLRAFSGLLLKVALTLTVLILAANVALQRPLIDAVLFSLAIAVGITPQLLPAVVSTSLAAGSRMLARKKVLVKRLVCIEDLGDMDLLITDKTGTLTEGKISFLASLDPSGKESSDVVNLGLLATDCQLGACEADPVGPSELDAALWQARPTAWPPKPAVTYVHNLPFDHVRRMSSVLIKQGRTKRLVVTKGAPEQVMAACVDVPEAATATLEALAREGARIVAVASREAGKDEDTLTAASEARLHLAGFLTFRDSPKKDAAASLHKLNTLGVTTLIATGDHPLVAEKVFADLGLTSRGTLLGTDIDALADDALVAKAEQVSIFARVTPEHKERIVRLLRRSGRAVGFLGDGVNDALALHAADIGISVDTGADVAKDAADVILLKKDLGVLADGIAEGRRVFANTIKYVLMGTSSNFGNMFSAAAASAVLPFLPMLPGQILLNNLLYDTGQLTIPTDHVDPQQLRRPSHWDLGMIRRFMLLFGPLSSIFDFLTFAVMLGVLHAGPAEFRSGWFVESLATQTLIILAIRTRRVPFFRSRPSWQLATSVAGVVTVGIVLPMSPLADTLGFGALPPVFYLALAIMIVAYLVLVEAAKSWFNNQGAQPQPPARRPRPRSHRVNRRASTFSVRGAVRAPAARHASRGPRRPSRDGA